MKEIILAKYGEIALKGDNRMTFESILVKNIKRRLKKLGSFDISFRQSTVYIEPLDDADVDEAVESVKKVFGISAIQRCAVFPKDFEVVVENLKEYLDEALSDASTFKVEAKRSDKSFPMNSPEIQQKLGDAVLDVFPHLGVDVHNPEVTVRLEIRDNGAYLSAKRIPGLCGMPVGSSGKALLMLSGGIDSPVAGYMMAKRGLIVDCVHFASPPYTSERARMKVERLCEELCDYCGDMLFYCVPFTEIQEKIRDNCPEMYFTVIMRRLMIEIANQICEKNNYGGIITGESLAQVASQTLPALGCTNAAARVPVFRPLIGMDKVEITDISRKINTFETSILPYEDCCTVFSPKHPCTRPKLSDVIEAENSFDFSEIIKRAVENTEVKRFRYGEQKVFLD